MSNGYKLQRENRGIPGQDRRLGPGSLTSSTLSGGTVIPKERCTSERFIHAMIATGSSIIACMKCDLKDL